MGVLVFGLMASVMVGSYTVLILRGYTPPAEVPYQVFFPQEEQGALSFRAFLVASTLCLLLLTGWAWRSLVGAARRDQQVRRLMAEGRWPPPRPAQPPRPAPAPPAAPEAPPRREEGPPPGYQ